MAMLFFHLADKQQLYSARINFHHSRHTIIDGAFSGKIELIKADGKQIIINKDLLLLG
ncbi:MAG: hypothetical protein ACJAZP_003661 [Psychromonas sp.]|jgi:hypothetical protein